MALREKVLALIHANQIALAGELKEDTSLIRSGLLDSAALFSLAVLIESEVGANVDPKTFDLARDWDTIADISNFIARRRAAR